MSGTAPHLLHSHTLPRYLARLRERSDISPLLREYGLPPETPDLPEVEIPLERFHLLADALAARLDDPFMGLNLSRAIPPAAFGVVELSARSAPSFRAATQRLVRYIGLLNDFEHFSLEEDGGEARIDHRIPGVPLALGRHGNEQLLALMTRVIREILQRPDWAPTQVTFAHPAPVETGPLAAFFGTSALAFSRGHDALHFPAAALELPVSTANATLLHVLDAQAHRELGSTTAAGDELGRVREAIRRELQDGAPELSRVASALKMSGRTLQRRLGEHALSFSQVVDETRCDLARDHLASSNLALGEVAFLLGYSDLAAFIRAFKRWTGLTPKAFRDQHAKRS